MEEKSDYNINYKKFHLSNGIKCILYPRKEIHSVTIEVCVNVGSLDETQENNGISHFLEHVVHDGTKEMPTWQDVDNFTNEYSGSTNAFTSLDITQYYGTFPFQYLDKAIYYFSQIVLHPLIKESDVNKERDIILDEKQRYEDEVGHKQILNIKKNRFEHSDSSFSFEIIGEKDGLEIYTQKDIQSFYSRYYTAENIEVYITGQFEVEDAKKLLEKYFGEAKSAENGTRSFKKDYPEYSNFKVNALKKDDISQTYLTIDFPSPEFSLASLEKRYKVEFLKSVLASSQYFQSILWKRLREELNIVYGVSASTYDMFSRSIFIINTSFDKKHLSKVLEEVYSGVETLKKGSEGKIVFDSKKKRVIDTMLMQLDKPNAVLDWISNYEDELQENDRAFTISEYLNFVENLEFEKIIELANEIFDWNKAQIGIVSKEDVEQTETQVGRIWDGVFEIKN